MEQPEGQSSENQDTSEHMIDQPTKKNAIKGAEENLPPSDHPSTSEKGLKRKMKTRDSTGLKETAGLAARRGTLKTQVIRKRSGRSGRGQEDQEEVAESNQPRVPRPNLAEPDLEVCFIIIFLTHFEFELYGEL